MRKVKAVISRASVMIDTIFQKPNALHVKKRKVEYILKEALPSQSLESPGDVNNKITLSMSIKGPH